MENGRLYMLQCRNGKRTAKASVKIAVDMVKEGTLTEQEALLRIPANQMDFFLHPTLDPNADKVCLVRLLLPLVAVVALTVVSCAVDAALAVVVALPLVDRYRVEFQRSIYPRSTFIVGIEVDQILGRRKAGPTRPRKVVVHGRSPS